MSESPQYERRKTTWYLQKEQLSPAEMNELADRVYERVRRLAESKLIRFPKLKSRLRPTEVANEAWIRLLRSWKGFDNGEHFTKQAFKIIEHILVDHYRRLQSKGRYKVTKGTDSLDQGLPVAGGVPRRQPTETALQLAQVKERVIWFNATRHELDREHPDLANTIAMNLVGMTEREIAKKLGITRHRVREQIKEALRFFTERLPRDEL